MKMVTIEEYAAKLYIMDTTVLEDKDLFKMNYEKLSKKRRSKIDSYYFEKDKRLSLGAGILFDTGLSSYGLEEPKVVVGYGVNGKPYLPGEPHIHFNISHSEKMVLAVFADVETGCDVELIKQADLKLAKRFFCPGEYRYLVQQAGERQQDEAFYRLWTLKESFVKTTGTGLSLPMNQFEVKPGPNGETRVCQQVDGAKYYFREYKFDGYCAAVCFREG